MSNSKSPKSWKLGQDSLYRGDMDPGPTPPTFGADKSIIRHILYLEGLGRETPYLSTSELQSTAQYFSRNGGRIYVTNPSMWPSYNVAHIPRTMLNQLLTGKGKGNASWSRASDVRRARELVELHSEHLSDFAKFTSQTDINTATAAIFK
ncbi:hypothetical protein [Rhodanobacter sp. C06]|uniref:hypothetical protein n=1 Tax=Rhodanobacter sp. C06 TaxID=1945854 RepID=UPI00111582C9|nr:hypothetical protein [Rhodanobacter sp. C06]